MLRGFYTARFNGVVIFRHARCKNDVIPSGGAVAQIGRPVSFVCLGAFINRFARVCR